MNGVSVEGEGEEILHANQALREWAAGLRQWSRSARQASGIARHRALALRTHQWSSPLPADEPCGEGDSTPELALPSLGDVRTSELSAVLVNRHGFSRADADSALAVGLLVAGYPADYPLVCGVDAFGVLEHAIQHRRP